MPRLFLAVLLVLGSAAVGYAEGRPGSGDMDSGPRATASSPGTVVVHFGMGSQLPAPDVPVRDEPRREALVTVVRGTGGDGEGRDHLARALAELCRPALPARNATAAAIGASF